MTCPEWERDHALVRASLAGDRQSWETLQREAFRKLLAVAKKCDYAGLFCEQDRQDIVQEALYRCYRRRDSYLPRSRFSTWAAGFVRYVALEENRKLLLRRSRGEAELARSGDRGDPAVLFLRRERDRCLWLALVSLPAPWQELILCRVLEERGKRETARRAGLPLRALDEEQARAIGCLRRRFLRLYEG